MEDTILSVNTLPEQLHRRFRSDRVRVHDEGGTVVLIPILEQHREGRPALNRLRTKLSDGRLSTENYLAQKRQDKELEG